MMTLSSRMYRFIVPREGSRSRSRSGAGGMVPLRFAAPCVAAPRVSAQCVAGPCLVAVLGCALSACSIAIPVPGMSDGLTGKADSLTTQSIGPSGGRLSTELTPDDWNFASIALAIALDRVGSGDVAPWANPRTGIRGDFVAAGKPYLRNDLVCRGFRANLQYHGGDEALEGAACRMPDGKWATTEAAPA